MTTINNLCSHYKDFSHRRLNSQSMINRMDMNDMNQWVIEWHRVQVYTQYTRTFAHKIVFFSTYKNVNTTNTISVYYLVQQTSSNVMLGILVGTKSHKIIYLGMKEALTSRLSQLTIVAMSYYIRICHIPLNNCILSNHYQCHCILAFINNLCYRSFNRNPSFVRRTSHFCDRNDWCIREFIDDCPVYRKCRRLDHLEQNYHSCWSRLSYGKLSDSFKLRYKYHWSIAVIHKYNDECK